MEDMLILELVRVALGTQDQLTQTVSKQQWSQVLTQARAQSILAVLYEGLLPNKPLMGLIPRDQVMRWMASSLSLERQMKQQRSLSEEFAQKMSEEQLEVVVLKGLAFAAYYPVPDARESGDLDCFMMGRKAQGDALAVRHGAVLEESGYKHSHLEYKGLVVENHAFLTDFDNSKRGRKSEKLLQKLLEEGRSPMKDSCLVAPSALFDALYLLKHAQRHFVMEGLFLRHVLDWFFLLEKAQDRIDWLEAASMMQQMRLMDFARVMTYICKTYLGLRLTSDVLLGMAEDCDVSLAEEVMEDILKGRRELYYHKNFLLRKGVRFWRNLGRMCRFRKLLYEPLGAMILNRILFSAIIGRKAELD